MTDEHLVKMTRSIRHGKGKGKGCVVKCIGTKWKDDHGSYRKNGYDEISGNSSKKAIYNVDFTRSPNKERFKKRLPEEKIGFPKGSLHTPKDPRLQKHRKAWWIGEAGNYKNCAYEPFNHESHHILPYDSLSTNLSDDLLELLMAAEYNLNDGINIIILPKLDVYADALMLAVHNGYHSQYCADVASIVEEIKQDVQEGAQNHEINEESAVSLKNRLEAWEIAEFDLIVKYGQIASAFKGSAHIDTAPMAQH